MGKKKQSAKEPVWHGDETRPGVPGSETPEEAATCAEGNAPISVDEAVRRAAEEDHPTVPDTARPKGANESDSEENAEEKRIAAAEEHAEQPRRGFQGKL